MLALLWEKKGWVGDEGVNVEMRCTRAMAGMHCYPDQLLSPHCPPDALKMRDSSVEMLVLLDTFYSFHIRASHVNIVAKSISSREPCMSHIQKSKRVLVCGKK